MRATTTSDVGLAEVEVWASLIMLCLDSYKALCYTRVKTENASLFIATDYTYQFFKNNPRKKKLISDDQPARMYLQGCVSYNRLRMPEVTFICNKLKELKITYILNLQSYLITFCSLYIRKLYQTFYVKSTYIIHIHCTKHICWPVQSIFRFAEISWLQRVVNSD